MLSDAFHWPLLYRSTAHTHTRVIVSIGAEEGSGKGASYTAYIILYKRTREAARKRGGKEFAAAVQFVFKSSSLSLHDGGNTCIQLTAERERDDENP